LVKHTPHSCYRQTWIPRLPDHKGRKTFWIFAKLTRLKHLGDVTVVLTKKGRNVGPQNTKLLVTNLLELTARQVIDIYQRRWAIEILFKELKSGLGLGEHQVTKKLPRIEKSLGIALIAYLFLLRARKDDIRPGKPWSIFQLKTNFTMDLIQQQFQHSIRLEVNKSNAVDLSPLVGPFAVAAFGFTRELATWPGAVLSPGDFGQTAPEKLLALIQGFS